MIADVMFGKEKKRKDVCSRISFGRSLGITLIEMRDGVPPLNDVHPMIAMRRVRGKKRKIVLVLKHFFVQVPTSPPPRLQCEEECSAEMVQFVAQCLIKGGDHEIVQFNSIFFFVIRSFRKTFFFGFDGPVVAVSVRKNWP